MVRESMMTRMTRLATLMLLLGAACRGGTGSAESDASIVPAADADPFAPDADPTAVDAGGEEPGEPDARQPEVIDAGGSGTPGTIDCGDQTCTIGSEECCFSGGVASCVSEGMCQGTSSSCDGPEDCGGDTCCGTFAGAECSATCEGNQSFELCHDVSDCSFGGDMCCDFGPVSVCSPSCMGGP